VIAERDVEVLADTIKNDAEKRSVSLFIVGLPKNMDGSVGERARKSEAFAERLRELSGIEVKLWDERLTTVDAHRILTRVGRRRQKKTVDAVAATLILEGYLNSVG
jgi:putative Holliday junction resolvase